MTITKGEGVEMKDLGVEPSRAGLTVADVLARAADLIEPEGAWTQGEFARDEWGMGLEDPLAPAACSWCAWGAIIHVVGEDEGGDVPAYGELSRTVGAPIPAFNDAEGRTQAEVVAALRAAAAKARDGS